MANKGAENFVAGLRASIESWHMSDQTKTLYVAKLSRYQMTDYHWSALLDVIIEKNVKGVLPTIKEIIDEIGKLKALEGDYGFIYFNLGQIAYAVRLMHRENVWVSVKTAKYFNPPATATDVMFVPDKPAPIDQHDLPSRDEVREYFRQIEEKLDQLTRREL